MEELLKEDIMMLKIYDEKQKELIYFRFYVLENQYEYKGFDENNVEDLLFIVKSCKKLIEVENNVRKYKRFLMKEFNLFYDECFIEVNYSKIFKKWIIFIYLKKDIDISELARILKNKYLTILSRR